MLMALGKLVQALFQMEQPVLVYALLSLDIPMRPMNIGMRPTSFLRVVIRVILSSGL